VNHLGHFLLAPEDDAARAGTLMADVVRGTDLGAYHPRVALGIRLHRRVDALVDSAPELLPLREHVAAPLRRYAGIVLDVLIDHVLIRHWPRVHESDRSIFQAGVYGSLERMQPSMPEAAARIAQRLRAWDLLDSCGTLEGCERTLEAIARRLKRPVPLAQGIGMLEPHLTALDASVLALVERLPKALEEVAKGSL
jgi:acyl carrier protein phosphodiesterase